MSIAKAFYPLAEPVVFLLNKRLSLLFRSNGSQTQFLAFLDTTNTMAESVIRAKPITTNTSVPNPPVMGYIVIPAIDVNLPIYHYTSDDVLTVDIGHIENSSLPVGGESTHCLLTGHSALATAKLFTDLDKLELSDKFYIKTLNETLCYEVDSILTVLPYDTSALQIIEGRDLVTLITCTPYGINSHRLLVRGTRVAYDAETDTAVSDDNESTTETTSALSAGTDPDSKTVSHGVWIWVSAGLVCISGATLVLIRKRHK